MANLKGSSETSRKEPPPTHPDVRAQAMPTRTSVGSSNEVATQYPAEEDAPEVTIAVMGATGSGKTTFINTVSGSNLDVKRGLRSCTEVVQIAGAFCLDGRRVVLIDTPGFDDTTRSDTYVLKLIAVFLETSYKRGRKLAGVLYFHRISDFKMTGLSRRNFSMFRKLCGDNTLKNVVIVTNMWGEVDPQIGDEREAELKGEDIFFKPVLDQDAKMARHENTVPSAESIIRLILDNHPLPLRIQRELVDEQMDISETGAGEELNREINAKIRRIQEEMHSLKEEMEQARKEKDEQTRKELEIEIKMLQREVERFQNDARRLESDYKQEKERLEARLEQMEYEAREEADRMRTQYQRQTEEKERLEARLEEMEFEARQEADRMRAQYQQQTEEKEMLEARLEQMGFEARQEAGCLRAQYQRQIDELRRALDQNAESSEKEKVQMREKIEELSKTIRVERLGLFKPAGAQVDRFLFRPLLDRVREAIHNNEM